ncbi:MAG: Unknown protein [uncultured Sulfurovum sp.]|uniref:Uncharacterized protein n=1 Tax=uncultured Sulfurovum sp. TaxID=269237 RepID=A0A6S6U0Y6_9BACT|nr:MAG: Unknown protein [uncultured Sulfurovum sp.]
MENSISKTKNYLLDLSDEGDSSDDLQYLLNNFSGTVIKSQLEIKDIHNSIRVYALGNMEQIKSEQNSIFIVEELSFNYQKLSQESFQIVQLGKVPINIYDAGVYYREFFKEADYFTQIQLEHTFQELTESNKASMALRKGIYLSKIVKKATKEKNETLHFNLLRCSSNLKGSTDNFRKTDHDIVEALNETVKFDFEEEGTLNHVLAQIYYNKKKGSSKDTKPIKEIKAKIKAHSDKTKDMPKEGLIAFCTFYDKEQFEALKPSRLDKFDWSYKATSGLTKILFKLKNSVHDRTLKKEFTVTLYPNSVFLIPLSTNRRYTHEIRPSVLNIDKIPTRMGYVIRCSNLEAVYMNKQTYIKQNDDLIKLERMNTENMKHLQERYYQENQTEEKVDYGKVHFSMNLGDYEKPMF